MVRENLRDFLDNSSIGIHTVSSKGIIEYANHFELEMLGYQEVEYSGHHVSEFQVDSVCLKDMMTRLGKFELLTNYPARVKGKNNILHILYNSSVYQVGKEFIHTRCFGCEIEEHVYHAFKENFPY
jgi:hypothetical protein